MFAWIQAEDITRPSALLLGVTPMVSQNESGASGSAHPTPS